MTEPISGIGSPIAEYIKQAREQTQAALGDWELKEPMMLELSTVVRTDAGGKLQIQVLHAGANVVKEEVHKMQIAIGPKDPLDEEFKKAKIHATRMQPMAAAMGVIPR